jgi:hypothetical protein
VTKWVFLPSTPLQCAASAESAFEFMPLSLASTPLLLPLLPVLLQMPPLPVLPVLRTMLPRWSCGSGGSVA